MKECVGWLCWVSEISGAEESVSVVDVRVPISSRSTEGRDASTKILPNSDVKFFFKCNLNIASKRRYKELNERSKTIKLNDVKKALYKRNLMDKTRKISPLQKHPDAVVVNTGKLSKKAVLDKMSKHVERVLKRKYGK